MAAITDARKKAYFITQLLRLAGLSLYRGQEEGKGRPLVWDFFFHKLTHVSAVLYYFLWIQRRLRGGEATWPPVWADSLESLNWNAVFSRAIEVAPLSQGQNPTFVSSKKVLTVSVAEKINASVTGFAHLHCEARPGLPKLLKIPCSRQHRLQTSELAPIMPS